MSVAANVAMASFSALVRHPTWPHRAAAPAIQQALFLEQADVAAHRDLRGVGGRGQIT
jgi:hypothetical protein